MNSMNHLLPRPALQGLVFALAILTLAGNVARAVPYASCITNNAGTVTFYLNEAATNVTVIYDGGGVGNTNNLGLLSKGPHPFSMTGHASYAIVVSNTTPAGWVKTSTDSNTLLQFNYGRGITVNYHPQDTRLFGRIYIANGYLAVGTATNVNLHTYRTLSQGLYALNADQSDALGQGNTGKKPSGITWNASSNDPYKIAVGKNDTSVYLNTYSSLYSCTWSIDGDLAAATQMLYGLGSNAVHYCSISSPVVTGSLAGNNYTLWWVDAETVGHYCEVAQWVIGGGPLPWDTAQTGWAGATRIPPRWGWRTSSPTLTSARTARCSRPLTDRPGLTTPRASGSMIRMASRHCGIP